jgi:hypothetical protein
MKSLPLKRCEGTGGGAELTKALSAFVHYNYKTSPNFTESDFKAVDSGLEEVRILRDRAITVSNAMDSNPEAALETLQVIKQFFSNFSVFAMFSFEITPNSQFFSFFPFFNFLID